MNTPLQARFHYEGKNHIKKANIFLNSFGKLGETAFPAANSVPSSSVTEKKLKPADKQQLCCEVRDFSNCYKEFHYTFRK